MVAYSSCLQRLQLMKTTWANKTRRNLMAKLPYAYLLTKSDPLALESDLECIKWVEQGFDKYEEAISESMRNGTFNYDMTGAAR